MPKTKQVKLELPPPTSEIVTFRDVRGWTMDGLLAREPSCFNGVVNVRCFRVTVEIVEEPDQLIIERIRKLWRECDNHHHWQPLRAAAAQYGFELSLDEYGKDKSLTG